MGYIFAGLDEKRKLLGGFEKILKIFDGNSMEKLNFKTQVVGKFWENFENLWWKFYRKIEFYLYFILFFESLLLKIEA